MSNTDEPTTPSAAAPASTALTLARIGAVVMAISVVAYLVWDAQVTANPEQTPVVPAAGADGEDALSEDPGATQAGREVLMPSSKFAPVDIFGPSGNNGKPNQDGEILLSGSKSGLLPSSKVIVLPSSKSGRPIPAASDEMKKVVKELREKLKDKKD